MIDKFDSSVNLMLEHIEEVRRDGEQKKTNGRSNELRDNRDLMERYYKMSTLFKDHAGSPRSIIFVIFAGCKISISRI